MKDSSSWYNLQVKNRPPCEWFLKRNYSHGGYLYSIQKEHFES